MGRGHQMMNRLLLAALISFLAVGAFAYTRSAKQNTSPPHVPAKGAAVSR